MKPIFIALLLGALCVLSGRTVSANGQRRTTNDAFKEGPITRADLPGFLVIGIEARTTNAKEATAEGMIPRQWQRFFQEGILEKIPNTIGGNIYAVHTDYPSDPNADSDFVLPPLAHQPHTPP